LDAEAAKKNKTYIKKRLVHQDSIIQATGVNNNMNFSSLEQELQKLADAQTNKQPPKMNI